MTEFRKEQRYVVAKVTDLDYAVANKFISQLEVDALNQILAKVALARAARKDDSREAGLDCVVVESDWRCYATVWDLVEAEHIVNQGDQTQ